MNSIEQLIGEVAKVKPEIFPFYFQFTSRFESKTFVALQLSNDVNAHNRNFSFRDTYQPGIICLDDAHFNIITWFEYPTKYNKSTFELIDPMLGMYVDIKEKHNVDFKHKYEQLIKCL